MAAHVDAPVGRQGGPMDVQESRIGSPVASGVPLGQTLSLLGAIARLPSTLLSHGSRLVNWFLPRGGPAAGDASSLRDRLTVVTGLCGGLAVLVAVLVTTDDSPLLIRVTSFGLSAGFFAVPFMLRFGTGHAVAQRFLLAVMVAYASFLAFSTGGKDTGAAFVAMLVPLVSTLLCGARAGLRWSLVTCAAFTGIAVWVMATDFVPPVQPDFEAVALWNLWAASIGSLGSLSVASTYEWLRDEADERLREEKAQSDRLRTEQRRVDAQFQAELQSLVRERTQALETSQQELRRVERLASIGTLTAGIAHQINNPVGSILLASQYALACDDDEDREQIWREALQKNEIAALRCARIVRSLLKFSAAESSQKSVHDLTDVVTSGIQTIREEFPGREQARIEFSRATVAQPILADPVEIEQVVANLVRNAIEACDDGQGSVRVWTETRDGMACLCVADEGRGIPEEDQPRIYDPFFSTRTREGGTGLGLSVVHGIVQDHAGSIDIESAPERGTLFTVRFPLA